MGMAALSSCLCQGGELIIQPPDRSAGGPGLQGCAELSQPAGCGCISRAVEVVGGLYRDAACLVDFSFVKLHGREVAEEDGALLDGVVGEPVERVGKSRPGLVEPLCVKLGVAGEPVEPRGVVVVEPPQCRMKAGRIEGSAGTIDGGQRTTGRAGVCVHL